MSRFTRIVAATAAAASLAVAAAAPASASTADDAVIPGCYPDPDVVTCVDAIFGVADRVVIYAGQTYDRVVQPQVDYVACVFIEATTPRDC